MHLGSDLLSCPHQDELESSTRVAPSGKRAICDKVSERNVLKARDGEPRCVYADWLGADCGGTHLGASNVRGVGVSNSAGFVQLIASVE